MASGGPREQVEYEDEGEGRDPNGPRRMAIPGDSGFTVDFLRGPLHGRQGRLRDSTFRLWYLVDSEDRPTVISARKAPELKPGHRVVGYYAFDEDAEAVTWNRADTPTEEGAPMQGFPRWFAPVIAAAATIAALSLAAIAGGSSPGRYQPVPGEPVLLDTETGRTCSYAMVGQPPRCTQTATR